MNIVTLDVREPILCNICDDVEIDSSISNRCTECNVLCDEHIQRKMQQTYANILINRTQNCEICGTKTEICGAKNEMLHRTCDTNVEINWKKYNCYNPFKKTYKRFTCKCYEPINSDQLDIHHECFPVCREEREIVSRWCEYNNSPWGRNRRRIVNREFYLGVPFSRYFRKLLNVTNLENQEERTDLLIWIARNAHDYKIALDCIKENYSYDEVMEIVNLYPQIVNEWEEYIFGRGYVLK